MRHGTAIIAAAVLAAGIGRAAVEACTTFCVRTGNQVLFGRNYDFEFGRGLVVMNPARLEKTGFEPGGPAWVARHASLTFNQFGRDFPMGGMNDAGLVVELMWHERAEYPSADARKPLGVLQWIQYQLDTAASVDDVLRSDRSVRVQGSVPLHYLVADASGRVATIEFISGVLRAETGAGLPVSVLANDTYADDVAFWQNQKGRRASGSGSPARFARAADAVRAFETAAGPDPVSRAFAILDDVAQRNTRWSIVYDQVNRVVRFRTDTNRQVRRIALESGGQDCARGAEVLDANAQWQGDVRARFEAYTEARNRALVEASYREFSATRQSPREEIERVIAYPSTARCQGS